MACPDLQVTHKIDCFRPLDAEINIRSGRSSSAHHVCKVLGICSKRFCLVKDLGLAKLPSEIISIG